AAGFVCEALGDFERALAHYDKALAVAPYSLRPLQNRGIVLARLGRLQDAVESNRRLVALAPASIDARHNLTESLLAARRYGEAVDAAQAALAIDPTHGPSLLDLGLALATCERFDEARSALLQVPRSDAAIVQRVGEWAGSAGVVDPVDVSTLFQPEDIYLTMHCERLDRCEWDGLDALVARCTAMLRAPRPEALRTRALAFKLLLLPLPASAQRTIADRIAEEGERSVSALARPPARTTLIGAERIRIGYLSADFGTHPVGFLTRSLYALHERARFEVLAYSLTGDDGSENFRHIAGGCDRMT